MYSFFKRILKNHCSYLFLAVLGLVAAWALSNCSKQASHCGGFSCCRAWALERTSFRSCGSWVLEHRFNSRGPQELSCPAARGIFPDQGSNPCLLHWQADSWPPSHQGSPLATSWSKGLIERFELCHLPLPSPKERKHSRIEEDMKKMLDLSSPGPRISLLPLHYVLKSRLNSLWLVKIKEEEFDLKIIVISSWIFSALKWARLPSSLTLFSLLFFLPCPHLSHTINIKFQLCARCTVWGIDLKCLF